MGGAEANPGGSGAAPQLRGDPRGRRGAGAPLTFIRLGSWSRTSSLNSPAVSVPFLPSLAAKVKNTVTMRSMAISSSVSSVTSVTSVASAVAMAPDTPLARGCRDRSPEGVGGRGVSRGGPSPPPQPGGSARAQLSPAGLRRVPGLVQDHGEGQRGPVMTPLPPGPGAGTRGRDRGTSGVGPELRAAMPHLPPRCGQVVAPGRFRGVQEVWGGFGRFYTCAAGGDSAAFVSVPPAPVLGFLVRPDGRADTARAPPSVPPSVRPSVRASVRPSVLCSLPTRAPDQTRAELAAASAAPPGDLRWGQEGTAGRESPGAGASPGTFHRTVHGIILGII